MPQISQIAATYASQIFWLLIVFGLIYFGIGRTMLPKIEGVMEARDKKIADDLAAAEQARAQADATEAAYRQRMDETRAAALKATQDAKASAAAEGAVRVKAADAELAAQAAEADARIKQAHDNALVGIEDVAAEAAQDIVARISGIMVPRGDADAAVKVAMANG